MKVVVQRVKKASVYVSNEMIGSINHGFLLYIGIKKTDDLNIAEKVVHKIKKLRIFEDDQQKMNLNLKQVGGSILAISQFTLYGDTKHNNRPSFVLAANHLEARPIYDYIVNQLKQDFHVETGMFQEHMEVSSINDGPATIIIEID